MSYPKRLLRLRPHGIVADLPASEVGLDYWTGGQNIQFRGGVTGRVLGSRVAYNPSPVTPYALLNARAPGGITQTNFWLVFGSDSVYAVETENVNEVTPNGGLQEITHPYQWSVDLLNNIPVANNALDAPMYWGGDVGTAFAPLPDWPAGTSCKTLVAHKYHLFALDITGPSGHFEGQVLWSDAAPPGSVPGTWTAAPDNQAGDAELGDTPGPALAAKALRGSLLVYKRSGTYAFDYVGGNDIYAIRPLFTSSGCLTRRAVCDLNGQHLVVTDGDIILTDGTSRQSIGQARMRQFLFRQLDQEHYENLFVTYHRARDEAWICFPELGSSECTLALVYNVSNDAFSIRELAGARCAAIGVVNDTAPSEAWEDDNAAWESDDSPWNEANYSLATESLVVGEGDVLTLHDVQDAQTIQASVARHDLTLGEAERVKFIRRVHVRAGNFATLYIRVGARMTSTEPTTWSSEVALTSQEQIVDVFTLGRYLSIEIRSSDDAVWTLHGLDIEYEQRGYF